MQRLSGLDASFLYLETPSSHMHVAGLMILDPSSAEGGVTLEDVKAVYSERLHLAPPFRRRLVEVPFGLHHPLWVEDPDFDIDYHIRATALPSPGTPEQLSTLVGRLSALPLDRTRPLWEVWVIEGLEDGNVAVLSKVHHAAIDGASGNELTVALLDLTPEVAVHEPDEEWVPDHIPNEVELLTYALTSLARQPLRVVRALSKTTGAALAVRRRNREEPNLAPPPSPFSAPRTSFNTAISPRRSFAYTTVSLPTVKAVKNATGVDGQRRRPRPLRGGPAALPRRPRRAPRRSPRGDGAGLRPHGGRQGDGQPRELDVRVARHRRRRPGRAPQGDPRVHGTR